tara:strand:+ start:2417 stop:3100 length:684 start_codon:yes stop_codon:yes gene_type:complete
LKNIHVPKKLLALVIILLVSYYFVHRQFNLTFDQIESIVNSVGIFAPLVYALVLFCGLVIPFNPISDLITVNVAAFLFKPEVSILATFFAHTGSLVVNYIVARIFGEKIMRILVHKEASIFFDRFGNKVTPKSIFYLRFLLPITAIGIDIVTYLAAMRRIRFSTFYCVSIIPWTLISIIYFYSTNFLKNQSLMLFFVPAVLLILVPSVVILWRRHIARLIPNFFERE